MKSSMQLSIANKRVAAQFVSDLLNSSVNDLLSITITRREKYGACSVSIVTDMWSEDIVEKWVLDYFSPLISISPKITPVG